MALDEKSQSIDDAAVARLADLDRAGTAQSELLRQAIAATRTELEQAAAIAGAAQAQELEQFAARIRALTANEQDRAADFRDVAQQIEESTRERLAELERTGELGVHAFEEAARAADAVRTASEASVQEAVASVDARAAELDAKSRGIYEATGQRLADLEGATQRAVEILRDAAQSQLRQMLERAGATRAEFDSMAAAARAAQAQVLQEAVAQARDQLERAAAEIGVPESEQLERLGRQVQELEATLDRRATEFEAKSASLMASTADLERRSEQADTVITKGMERLEQTATERLEQLEQTATERLERLEQTADRAPGAAGTDGLRGTGPARAGRRVADAGHRRDRGREREGDRDGRGGPAAGHRGARDRPEGAARRPRRRADARDRPARRGADQRDRGRGDRAHPGDRRAAPGPAPRARGGRCRACRCDRRRRRRAGHGTAGRGGGAGARARGAAVDPGRRAPVARRRADPQHPGRHRVRRGRAGPHGPGGRERPDAHDGGARRRGRGVDRSRAVAQQEAKLDSLLQRLHAAEDSTRAVVEELSGFARHAGGRGRDGDGGGPIARGGRRRPGGASRVTAHARGGGRADGRRSAAPDRGRDRFADQGDRGRGRGRR